MSEMSLEGAKEILRQAQTDSVSVQLSHKEEILTAIKVFWASYPTEVEFGRYIAGIVLFPRLLWMIGQPRATIEIQRCPN